MLGEIQKVLPRLKQTIASFKLTDPTEVGIYDDMIRRLEQALGVDWSKFHAIHSAVKPAKPKVKTQAAPLELANGIVSVPGPKGAGDVTPAMLSPGEAVIPTAMAKKYAPIIQAMIAGKIPGYSGGTSQKPLVPLKGSFEASHFGVEKSFIPIKDALDALKSSGRENSEIYKNLEAAQKAGATQARAYTNEVVALSKELNQLMERKGKAPIDLVRQDVAGPASADMHIELERQLRNAGLDESQIKERVDKLNVILQRKLDEFGDKAEMTSDELNKLISDGYEELAQTDKEVRAARAEMRKISTVKDTFSRKQGGKDRQALSSESYREQRKTSYADTATRGGFYGRHGSMGTSEELAKSVNLNTGRELKAEIDKMSVQQQQELAELKQTADKLKAGQRDYSEFAKKYQEFVSLNKNSVEQQIESAKQLDIVQQKRPAAKGTPTAPPAALAGQFNDEAALAAETNPESERTKRIARNTVDGYAEELKRGEPEVEQAAKQTTDTIVRTIRRASSDPAVQADIDRRNQQPTQATTDSANIAAGKFRGYRGASREGDLEVRLREQAAAASVVNPEAIKAASEANLQNLQKMSMSISAVSFGLSSLTGVLSSFGVDLGGIMPVISGVTGALFALSAVTSALTQAKSAAIISERIAGAGGGVGGIGALFTELKGGAKGFKGFKNVIGRVAAAFGRMFPVISRLIIPLGIVATLFAGWELYNRIQEEARLKIEGLGDVATLTSEKINKLGGIFGVTPTATPLESVKPIISATGDVAADQRSMTQQVLDSEGFAEDYKNEIATISKAGKEEAELALKALAFKLSGKGFAKDQIDGIVSALVTEAKRTDVKIEMGSIDLNIDTNQEILNAQIEQQMQILSAAYQTSHRKMMDDNESLFGLEDDFFGDSVGYMPEASSGVAMLQVTAMKKTLDEDLKTSLATLGGVFQSLFIGLSGQLASGTISVGQFNLKFEELSQKILDMPEPEALVLMESVIKNLPGDMQNLINGLSGVADQMILIKAASAGVVITPEQQKAIEAGSENNASDTEITAKNKALEEITKTTTEYIELINQGTKVSPEEALLISNEELDAQSEKLRDQIFAYGAMTDAGFSAAEAIRLMGNEALVASIKQNGMTAETIASARELLDLEAQLRAITSAAGGGQKSAFQEAIDSLKEQRQEIKNSISAYAGLRSAGLGVAEASEIAKDSMLAAALASQKVGSAKWNQLVTAIRAARAEEEAWLQSTPEGRAEHFAEVYGKVMDVFSAQEAILDMNNEAATAANRKIIETLEKQIDAYERRASELQRDLDKIAEKEDEINKAYDEKTKALEKVKKLNQDITNQQKSQLSIADALSRGDISAAASAVEDSRAQFASSQGDATQRGFDAQRDAQLNALTENGKTRAQIEAEIKQIKKDISVIEFGALQNARDAVERADELTKAAKENLKVQGKTKTEWENINTRIDASKANAALYETEVAKALLNAQGLVGEWSKLNDTFTTTHVVNTVWNGTPAAPIVQATTTPGALSWNPFGAAASGGYISGPGTATSDSIPAMLSDGEYVIKAASVNKFGKNFLDAINAGRLPGFRLGGMIRDGGGSSRPTPARPVGRVSADAAERRAQAAKPAGKGYDTPAPTAAAPTKSMTEKILDVAEKISPLVAMAREGFAIAGSLGNLGRGKATTEDYLTLGLGALNFIPGGRGVSAGVKAARQGNSIIPKIQKLFSSDPNVLQPRQFSQALSNPAIVTRRSQNSVESMLRENNVKTLFDTGTSGGSTSQAMRANLEQSLFGKENIEKISYGILANKKGLTRNLPFFRTKDMFDPFQTSILQYGDTLLNLKRSAFKKTSLTAGDSLNNFERGLRANDNFLTQSLALANKKAVTSKFEAHPMQQYVEAQIRGLNPRTDIKNIWASDAKSAKELSAVVKELGLRIPVKISPSSAQRETQTVLGNVLGGLRNSILNPKTAKTRLDLFKKQNFDLRKYNPFTNKLGKETEMRINTLAKGGMVKSYAKGGLATNKFAMGGLVSPKYFAMGGLVSPKYFADGGMARGTDTVPSMLTPGEFVVNKKSTDMYGPLLAAMNSSPASNLSMMGAKTFSEPVYNMPSKEYVAVGENTGVYSTSGALPSQTTLDNSVYNNNSYSISVNVSGTSSNANDIANAVMNKIKTIESQQVKRQVLR
jgi:hypothetical protein